MMNTYTIYYRRPYNPHKTYFQNLNRNIACRIVEGKEAMLATVEEIGKAGFPVLYIYNCAGKLVHL